ncbi:hypothetical protein GQ600_8714 [Phytophthora cactorum]|nr:hypothetical protein GQ600_8714 [Phytophthora cactorum]
MESIPLPELLTCRLSIKNGEPFDACRDKVPPSPAFLYKHSEKKIEEHFESKLPDQWKPTFDIYLKPSNNAKQKQFEIVCQETVALLAQRKGASGNGDYAADSKPCLPERPRSSGAHHDQHSHDRPKSLPTANPAYLEGLGPQTPAGDNPELKKVMKELAGSSNSANYHTIDPHSLPTQDPPSLESRAAATSPRSYIHFAKEMSCTTSKQELSLRHTRAPNRSRIQVSESVWVQSLGVGGLGVQWRTSSQEFPRHDIALAGHAYPNDNRDYEVEQLTFRCVVHAQEFIYGSLTNQFEQKKKLSRAHDKTHNRLRTTRDP